ncbi:MAG: SMC-Scp complex subunit ScpB [Rhodospirillum sp.]|jgi:segregation and condensation protein B|nr:SMC-Scp complex subunit ScpB [Rhodospirillum sp.]
MTDDRFQLLRLLEAILFAATEPLHVKDLAGRMPEGADINGLLQELKDLYANRGVHLLAFDDRWAFRTAPDLASKFHMEKEVVRKLSRAAIETLAIIAYHQPVTRAEIEDIRGVAVSAGTLDMLLEIGWIKPKGRRETPGRPVTWATTDAFLEHFGLESCDALPGVEELKAAGLLDARATVATLGTQGLPNGAPVAEEEDEDGNISDMLAQRDEDPEAQPADDAYEAEALRRAEAEGSAEGTEDADGDEDSDEDLDDDEDFDDDEDADEDEDEVESASESESEGEGDAQTDEDSDDVSGSRKPKAAAQSD